ncbi:hypothetical protein P8452_73879 [Trifolium repens]|nr:hypothetical protein P8452_73879 [Trifolium repens]
MCTQLIFLYKTHQKSSRLEHFRWWPTHRKNSRCAGKMFSVGPAFKGIKMIPPGCCFTKVECLKDHHLSPSARPHHHSPLTTRRNLCRSALPHHLSLSISLPSTNRHICHHVRMHGEYRFMCCMKNHKSVRRLASFATIQKDKWQWRKRS